MEQHLSNRQLFFLLFSVTVGFGLFGIVSNGTADAGTSTWVAVALCMVLCVPFVWILWSLGRKYEGKNLFMYARGLVGVVPAKLIALLYFVFYAALASVFTTYTASVIQYIFLENTPLPVIFVPMVLIGLFAVSKGLRNLARLFEIYGVIAGVMVLIMCLLMLTMGDLVNAQPVLELSRAKEIIKALFFDILIYFLPFSVLAMVPFKADENGKKGIRALLLGLAVPTGIFIFLFFGCIIMLGPDQTALFKDALVMAIKHVKLQGISFPQRLDIVFIIGWMISVICAQSAFLAMGFAASEQLVPALSKKKRYSVISVTVIAFCFLPLSYDEAETAIRNISLSVGVLVAIIPAVLFVVSKIRGAKK